MLGLFLLACLCATTQAKVCDRRELLRTYEEDPHYYLKCLPLQFNDRNPELGLWTKIRCPEETVFVMIRQGCVSTRQVYMKEQVCSKNPDHSLCDQDDCDILDDSLCEWTTESFKADTVTGRAFYQCLPKTYGNACGSWVRHSCSEDSVFKETLQACVFPGGNESCLPSEVVIQSCDTHPCPGASLCKDEVCCQPLPELLPENHYHRRRRRPSHSGSSTLCPNLKTRPTRDCGDGCPGGYSCYRGGCCPLTTCDDGILAVSFCRETGSPERLRDPSLEADVCELGSICHKGSCCPLSSQKMNNVEFSSMIRNADKCPSGEPLAGLCVKGCAKGYACYDNLGCCRLTTCPNGVQPSEFCDDKCSGVCFHGSCCRAPMLRPGKALPDPLPEVSEPYPRDLKACPSSVLPTGYCNDSSDCNGLCFLGICCPVPFCPGGVEAFDWCITNGWWDEHAGPSRRCGEGTGICHKGTCCRRPPVLSQGYEHERDIHIVPPIHNDVVSRSPETPGGSSDISAQSSASPSLQPSVSDDESSLNSSQKTVVPFRCPEGRFISGPCAGNLRACIFPSICINGICCTINTALSTTTQPTTTTSSTTVTSTTSTSTQTTTTTATTPTISSTQQPMTTSPPYLHKPKPHTFASIDIQNKQIQLLLEATPEAADSESYEHELINKLFEEHSRRVGENNVLPRNMLYNKEKAVKFQKVPTLFKIQHAPIEMQKDPLFMRAVTQKQEELSRTVQPMNAGQVRPTGRIGLNNAVKIPRPPHSFQNQRHPNVYPNRRPDKVWYSNFPPQQDRKQFTFTPDQANNKAKVWQPQKYQGRPLTKSEAFVPNQNGGDQMQRFENPQPISGRAGLPVVHHLPICSTGQASVQAAVGDWCPGGFKNENGGCCPDLGSKAKSWRSRETASISTTKHNEELRDNGRGNCPENMTYVGKCARNSAYCGPGNICFRESCCSTNSKITEPKMPVTVNSSCRGVRCPPGGICHAGRCYCLKGYEFDGTQCVQE